MSRTALSELSSGRYGDEQPSQVLSSQAAGVAPLREGRQMVPRETVHSASEAAGS